MRPSSTGRRSTDRMRRVARFAICLRNVRSLNGGCFFGSQLLAARHPREVAFGGCCPRHPHGCQRQTNVTRQGKEGLHGPDQRETPGNPTEKPGQNGRNG